MTLEEYNKKYGNNGIASLTQAFDYISILENTIIMQATALSRMVLNQSQIDPIGDEKDSIRANHENENKVNYYEPLEEASREIANESITELMRDEGWRIQENTQTTSEEKKK